MGRNIAFWMGMMIEIKMEDKMDNLLRMATYPRHNYLASSFFSDIFHLFKQKKIYPLQENCYLAFFGKKYSGDEKLVDANAGT